MSTSPLIELPGIARDLIQEGLITESECLRLLDEAKLRKRTFVRILIRSCLVPEPQLFSHLSQLFMVPLLDLEHVDPVRVPTDLIPFKLMVKHQLLPLRMLKGGVFVFGCTDPSDSLTSQTVQFVCQAKPDPVLVEASKLQKFFDSIRSTQGLESMAEENDAEDEGKPLQFWDFESTPQAATSGKKSDSSNEPSLDDFLGEGGFN